MQSSYAASFEREMGCTEAQWRGWLDQAVGAHRCTEQSDGLAVSIGSGMLHLAWHAATPRVIGLVSIPVLRVSFRFDGLDAAQRYAFMSRFDLYMQRGGG